MVRSVAVTKGGVGLMLAERRLIEVIGGAIPKRQGLLERNQTGKVAPLTRIASGIDHVATVENTRVMKSRVTTFVDPEHTITKIISFLYMSLLPEISVVNNKKALCFFLLK